jgi:GntR family transcriptional regulator
MEAVIPNPIHSKLLELKKPSALLKVSGITVDYNNQNLMYEESLYRSDLYNYHVDIHRKF